MIVHVRPSVDGTVRICDEYGVVVLRFATDEALRFGALVVNASIEHRGPGWYDTPEVVGHLDHATDIPIPAPEIKDKTTQ